MDIPILILVFNRPIETQRIFDAIKQVKPIKLYIAADGPRNKRLTDIELCDKTRAIFKKIDWPCEVKYLFRNQNLGCGLAVSSAISWFFEHEEMGIILEDDCLPNTSFFNFCSVMLNHYKNDNRIMHINGSNFQQKNRRGDANSYYFSMFSYVWGWATWRRAWQKYNYSLNEANSKDINWKAYTENLKIRKFWERTLVYIQKGAINTWDYQWSFSILKSGGTCIVPNKNLITNIGNTLDATHGTDSDTFWTINQPTENMENIVLNHNVSINTEADNFYYEKALNLPVNLLHKIIMEAKFLKLKYLNT